MPLAVGTKAPDFSLPTKTAEGPKQIKLSDNFGKKNTLLLFFPMAFTGVCTTEMCEDRKSTRLNSSHSQISYAVFCLKKKNTKNTTSFKSLCHISLFISPSTCIVKNRSTNNPSKHAALVIALTDKCSFSSMSTGG